VVDRTGTTVPTRAVTLSATTVRGTHLGATLKLNRALLGGRTGYFSAIVTARAPGGVTLRTPVILSSATTSALVRPCAS
jgi:hypothetical protein